MTRGKPSIELHPVRVLRIIEGLIGDPDENPLLGQIYKLCHQASSVDCSVNHPSWTDEALELEKQLVEDKTIPAWPLTDPEITAYTRNISLDLSGQRSADLEGKQVIYIRGSDFGISPKALPAGIWDTSNGFMSDHYNLRNKSLHDGEYLYESGNGNMLRVQV